MSNENFNFLMQNDRNNSNEDINSYQIKLEQIPCSLERTLNTPETSGIDSNRDPLNCFINELSDEIPMKQFAVSSNSGSTLINNEISIILNLDSSSNSQRSQLAQVSSSTVACNNSEFLKTSYSSSDPPHNEESYLRVIEQPTNRIRYRYKSEKGSHGGLTGESSTQSKKTYPTVKLENYHSNKQVYIKASLYTNEREPKSHVHKLMGKNCNEDGECTVPLSENMTATFQNLGILFIGKKEVPEIIFERKLQEVKILNAMVNNGNAQINDEERRRIHEEAEKESKSINLNSVRICFEAFIYENDMHYPICNAIYSRPIANQKSPDSGELKIIRMDKYSGFASGDEEIFLLCEKVNKKEIKIRFFETNLEGNQIWEAFGNFNETDVHHQVAIVFRTPAYRNQNIETPIQVYLQLYRPRDGEYSEPRPFTYKPNEFDKEEVERKRKKVSHFNSSQREETKRVCNKKNESNYQLTNEINQGTTSNHRSYNNVIIYVK